MRVHRVSVTFERTSNGRYITVTSEAVPNIQSTEANPDPVSGSADEISDDIPLDPRNSNDGNMMPQ